MSDYYKKYVKYKTKYFGLKKIIGGNKDLVLSNINDFISEAKELGLDKTTIMGKILSVIMQSLNISQSEYVVIASYCLKEFRQVSDLDVIVSNDAYEILKQSDLFEISLAKISQDERLVLKLFQIDPDAEIEFFPKDKNIGFPSNYFSLNNLQQNNLLTFDLFGNPYFNEKTCIDQYSDISKRNGEYYMGTEHKIPSSRILKNISHLELIMSNINDNEIKEYCEEKINYLRKILE